MPFLAGAARVPRHLEGHSLGTPVPSPACCSPDAIGLQLPQAPAQLPWAQQHLGGKRLRKTALVPTATKPVAMAKQAPLKQPYADSLFTPASLPLPLLFLVMRGGIWFGLNSGDRCLIHISQNHTWTEMRNWLQLPPISQHMSVQTQEDKKSPNGSDQMLILTVTHQMLTGNLQGGPECNSTLATWDWQQLSSRIILPPTGEEEHSHCG